MKAVARSLFWWPGLDRDIEKISASCQTCIQNLPMPTAAPPVSWPATNERWSRVHVDFAGPIAGKMILVVVDTHTKWVEAIPLVHANSETTVNCLRTIFSRFGVPRTLVSDNGPQFTSQEFETFAKNNNIVHLRCAPYHPQSNGAAERVVRTIKEGLRKMKGGKMEDNLVRLLFNYRRTPQKNGKSPAEMLLGYQIRSRLDSCFPPTLAEPSQGQDDWTLLPETSVYVRNYGSGDKWIPGRVKTASGSRMATVETSGGLAQRHADQVRLQRNDTLEQQQQPDRVIEQRLASSPPTTAEEGDPATNTPRCADSPVRVPGVTSPPQPTTKSAPTDNTARSPQQVLRRSTRTRRPVERFQF